MTAERSEPWVDYGDRPAAPAAGQPLWTTLTRLPIKAELYAPECYFRESFADATRILTADRDRILRNSALMMIKPEGLAGGKGAAIIEFLQKHDFEIVATEKKRLDRITWREMWRYQLSAATLDRLAVNDLMMIEPALILLLSQDAHFNVPASVRLSALKGPSDIGVQPPNCLRRLLAQPNRMFSMFHVSDEPADVVRELGILFDGEGRTKAFHKFVGGVQCPADEWLLRTTLEHSASTARAFEAGRVLDGLEKAVQGSPAPLAERLASQVSQMRRGERIVWNELVSALNAAALELENWDLALIGATFIDHDVITPKIIGSAGVDRWLTGSSKP